jgi:hypothetical protein
MLSAAQAEESESILGGSPQRRLRSLCPVEGGNFVGGVAIRAIESGADQCRRTCQPLAAVVAEELDDIHRETIDGIGDAPCRGCRGGIVGAALRAWERIPRGVRVTGELLAALGAEELDQILFVGAGVHAATM